jgi:hypothetical protein
VKEVVAVDVGLAETATEIDKIATDRPSRRAVGDNINTLAASMAVEGIRHPVLVMPSGDVLDGNRRIVAARSLGWKTIPARQVQYVEDAALAIVRAQDEHTMPRTMQEWVDQGLMLETLDHEHPGSVSDYLQYVIGPAVCASGSMYKRARLVVQTARSHARPRHVVEAAREAIRSIDAGVLTVSGAYTRLRVTMKADPPAEGTLEDGLPSLPPPSPAARSPKARQLRIQWIRALTAKGATTQQISDRIRIGPSAIRKIYRDCNITNTADAALNRSQVRAVDPNRAMRVILEDLDALIWSLDGIDVSGLDEAETAAWAKQLTGYARAINRASKRIQRSR